MIKLHRIFHSALDASRRQNLPLNEASALANLGYLAMWEERYDESSEWFKLAIEKSQQSGAQFALPRRLAISVGITLQWADFENAELMLNKA